MTHKGGGRESGDARVRSADAEIRQPTGVSAAANPAVHSHPSDCPCVRLHERIRELEAELARALNALEINRVTFERVLSSETVRAERAEARVKELEKIKALMALQIGLHARDERSPPHP